MRRVSALLLCLLLTACVSTNVASQRLPAAHPDLQPFQSLLVFNSGMSLANAQRVENVMLEDLSKLGVTVYKGTNYLPYDAPAKDVVDVAEQLRVDGVLLVVERTSKYIKSYVPPSYTPGTTSTKVQDLGDEILVTTTTTPGTYIGGYNTYSPFGLFAAHLFNFRDEGGSGKVWLADINSGGNADATLDQVFEDVARETVKKLQADGMVVPPPKK
jgi:hypothetical protein